MEVYKFISLEVEEFRRNFKLVEKWNGWMVEKLVIL